MPVQVRRRSSSEKVIFSDGSFAFLLKVSAAIEIQVGEGSLLGSPTPDLIDLEMGVLPTKTVSH